MTSKRACGKHTELVANETIRVSQCPCGTVHVTLMQNGLTVRLNEQSMKSATRGLMVALDKIEEANEAGNVRYGGGTCDA